MKYKIINDKKSFFDLKKTWNNLVDSDPRVTYFSSFKYCYSWVLEKFNRSNNLFIICVIHNNNVVGIAPLQIEKTKKLFLVNKVLKFISKGDYNNFIFRHDLRLDIENIISTFFNAINENKKLWDKIHLPLIPSNSHLSHYFLKRSFNNKNFTFLIETPYLEVKKYSSKDLLNIFKTKRKYYNKFLNDIDYDLLITNNNVINEISKIHIMQKEFMSLNGIKGRRSYYEDDKMLRFLNKLYTRNKNTLTYILKDNKNGNIIGYETGYLFKNIFHSYNIGFDPSYQKYRIGITLKRMIIEHNIEHKIWNRIDMGPGRYDWKFFLTSSFNTMYSYKEKKCSTKRIVFLKAENFLFKIFNRLNNESN